MKIPALLAFVVLAVAPAVRAATSFQTFQSADVVLGQPDFTSFTGVIGKPNRFSASYGAAMDSTTGKVFVSDYGNNRVLRFTSAAAAQSGANPEVVFGQANFTASSANQGGAVSASTLDGPVGVSVDSTGRLWVADYNNNRVLGFYLASYLGNNPPADIVVGQMNFTTSAAATTQAGLDSPVFAIAGPDDTLWVSDYDNNRILRYAAISSKPTSNASADGVLGQLLFVTNTAATTSSGLDNPAQLFPDAAGRLWVADYGNNRVLRFDAAAGLANNSAASAVLGQPDFTTGTTGLSSVKMNSPSGVYFDGSDLWVGDYLNRRVLRFASAASLSSGSGANLVLGQASFTVSNAAATAQQMLGPWNVSAGANGSLLVGDVGASRVLRFTPITTPGGVAPKPRAIVLGPKVFATTATRVLLRGRATDAGGTLRAVQVKVNNRPYRNASGRATWRFFAALKPGRNAIFVRAVDVSGAMSSAVRLTVTRIP